MKKVTLTVSFIIILSFPSCFFGNCPKVLRYFVIEEINIKNAKLVQGNYTDTVYEIENDDGMTLWNEFSMILTFDKQYTAKQETGFVSALYALDCPPNGHAGSKVGIDTLYLITRNDYNDNYLKNDTVNTMVLVKNYDYSSF